MERKPRLPRFDKGTRRNNSLDDLFTQIVRSLPTSGLKAIFREYCTLLSISRETGEVRIGVKNKTMCKLLCERISQISKHASQALNFDCNVVFGVKTK